MTTTLHNATAPLTEVQVPATSTLPDGDALGNEILAATGSAETRALIRKTSGGAESSKARRGDGRPRVMFQPRAWTMGGRVD